MGNDELSARARLRVGRTLKGKYRLDAVLGVGGMAAVYAATHRNRNRVAVKVLHPELAIDASLRARFIREGYVANTVDHPGTVRVLDDDVDDDGSVFLVMELLEGETLDALWERCGRTLGAKEVQTYIRDLLDVLVAAHANGIVHRDIKPENLFLTRDGALKVLDFGIARLRDASPSATRSGHVMGTPAFMPPEQALGRVTEIDAISDVWAVGATAFTLLTGRLVHEGQTPEELMVRAATSHAPHLRTAAASVRPELADIIDRALEYEKRDRWPNAQAMRDAISYLFEVDAYWATVQVHDVADDAKTRIVAPSRMERGDVTEPQRVPQLVTQPVATPSASTIAGVAARSPATRVRSMYAAAAGVIAAALVVTGLMAQRTGTNAPSPTTLPAPSPSSSTIVALATAAPSVPSTAPTANEALEVVSIDSLPRAAPLVRDAGPPVVRTTPPATAPAKQMLPSPATPPASTGSAASDTTAKCSPPFIVDQKGVRRWKLECL